MKSFQRHRKQRSIWDRIRSKKYLLSFSFYLFVVIFWLNLRGSFENTETTVAPHEAHITQTVVGEENDSSSQKEDTGLPSSMVSIVDDRQSRAPIVDENVESLHAAGENEYSVTEVCIIANNKRLASMFHLDLLRARGGGTMSYYVVDQDNKLKCPLGIPKVKMEFPLFLRSNLYRFSDVLIVEGDELCKCQGSICGDVRKSIFRQYYSNTYIAANGDSSNNIAGLYMPLGPRIEFGLVPRNSLKSMSERSLLFNCIMSPTSESRIALVNYLNSPPIATTLEKYKTKVHVTKRWHKELTHPGDISPDEYRQVVLNSKFTLCPGGKNPETFRFFEAVEAGSIPVLVKDEEYHKHPCQDAFSPLLATDPPILVLSSWEELLPAVTRLAQDPEALDAMQQRLLEWNTAYWKSFSTLFECVVESAFLIRHGITAGPTFQLPQRFQRHLDSPAASTADQRALGTCRQVMQQRLEETAARLPAPAAPRVAMSPAPLVTGCGRSGTLSVKDTLDSLGVPAVHEAVSPGKVSVSWLLAVPDAATYPFESAKSATQRLKLAASTSAQGRPMFSPVVLLVRHPLKVISSVRRCFCGQGDRDRKLGDLSDFKSWWFLTKHITVPGGSRSSVLRAATYWLEWNRLALRRHQAEMLVSPLRLEDLKPEDLLQGLGKQSKEQKLARVSVASSAAHTSRKDDRYPSVTWSDLYNLNATLAQEIWDLAQVFGYEEDGNFQQATGMKSD